MELSQSRSPLLTLRGGGSCSICTSFCFMIWLFSPTQQTFFPELFFPVISADTETWETTEHPQSSRGWGSKAERSRPSGWGWLTFTRPAALRMAEWGSGRKGRKAGAEGGGRGWGGVGAQQRAAAVTIGNQISQGGEMGGSRSLSQISLWILPVVLKDLSSANSPCTVLSEPTIPGPNPQDLRPSLGELSPLTTSLLGSVLLVSKTLFPFQGKIAIFLSLDVVAYRLCWGDAFMTHMTASALLGTNRHSHHSLELYTDFIACLVTCLLNSLHNCLQGGKKQSWVNTRTQTSLYCRLNRFRLEAQKIQVWSCQFSWLSCLFSPVIYPLVMFLIVCVVTELSEEAALCDSSGLSRAPVQNS